MNFFTLPKIEIFQYVFHECGTGLNNINYILIKMTRAIQDGNIYIYYHAIELLLLHKIIVTIYLHENNVLISKTH